VDLTPAEELLLISASPGSGRYAARQPMSFGVAGAVLMELALLGAIVVRDGRIIATDDWGGDPATAHAGPQAEKLWKRIREQHRPRRAAKWVNAAASDKTYAAVRAGLRDRGIVQAERGRVMGLFPRTHWTAADPAPGLEARDRLSRAMNGGGADDRTVALVLLADACGLSRTLFPQVARRARKDMIRKLSDGPWSSAPTGEAARAVAKGVSAAIAAAQAAAQSG
jgi:hypothetical protein